MFLSKLMLRVGLLLTLFGVFAVRQMLLMGEGVPQGDEIVYLSSVDGVWDLYILDIERALSYNLTRGLIPGSTRNRSPVWSPDGRYLVFGSAFNQQHGLLIYDTRMDYLRILDDVGLQGRPAWSPDGKWIAYAVYNGNDWDIKVQRVSDPNIHLVSATIDGESNDRKPLWSPDGETLVYVSGRQSNNDLYLIHRLGYDKRRLTNGMHINDNYVAWSPSGTHIAFTTERDGNSEIYTVNVETGALTNLTRYFAQDYNPVWSPDGTKIAFVSNRDGDDEIYLMDHFGGDVIQLTDNTVYDYDPVWSADGRYLLYVSVPDLTGEIHMIDIETGRIRHLTRNDFDDWSPVWKP